MYSAYKLNKQGDNIQPWHTPFPIWNQSVVPCPVLTDASNLHTDFSRGRSGGLVVPSLDEFSTVFCDLHSQRLWHNQWSRSRCFSGTLLLFRWSNDVGNLISGSSGFSKSSLNISKLTYCWVTKNWCFWTVVLEKTLVSPLGRKEIKPVRFSMSGSNCCFLTVIQVSQEAGKVVWYFQLFKNFPQFLWSTHWRRQKQPTPVFLPGESQGRGSLVGCRLWGRTELDTTEAT